MRTQRPAVAVHVAFITLLEFGVEALKRVGWQAPRGSVPERGYHGHDTCESPILVQPADLRQPGFKGGRFLICVPYKNGWEWWSKTICDSEGHGQVCHDGYSNRSQALNYLWWRNPDEKVKAFYNDSELPKVKLIRNPLTRVLAAWLTWVSRALPGEYNYVEDDFGDFVRHSMSNRSNCHWSRQVRHCGEDEGVQYELLKVEERGAWGPRILHRMGLTSAAQLNGGIRTDQLQSCPGHACSAMPLVKKYYTPELVRLVKKWYAEEIMRYNYTEMFDTWEDAIKWTFEDGMQLGRLRPGVSAQQARRDLELLEGATKGFDSPGPERST